MKSSNSFQKLLGKILQKRIFLNSLFIVSSLLFSVILISFYIFKFINRPVDFCFRLVFNLFSSNSVFKPLIFGAVIFIALFLLMKLTELHLRVRDIKVRMLRNFNAFYEKPEQNLLDALIVLMRRIVREKHGNNKKTPSSKQLTQREIDKIIEKKYYVDMKSFSDSENWSVFYYQGMKFLMYALNDKLIFNPACINLADTEVSSLVSVKINPGEERFMMCEVEHHDSVFCGMIHKNLLQNAKGDYILQEYNTETRISKYYNSDTSGIRGNEVEPIPRSQLIFCAFRETFGLTTL